jgi:hypothetical protein
MTAKDALKYYGAVRTKNNKVVFGFHLIIKGSYHTFPN